MHQVADQLGELAELAGDVAQDFASSSRGQHALAVIGDQQLDIGAQRGQRGAQLVAGVGDQPALPFPGRLQRLHHRVERPGQVGQLVHAARIDRLQLISFGDPDHRIGEALDRLQARTSDHPADRTGDQHGQQAEGQQRERQNAQDLIGGLQRAAQHHRIVQVAVSQRHRHDPVGVAGSINTGPSRRPGLGARDRQLPGRRHQRGGGTRRGDRQIVRADHQHGDVGGGQRVAVQPAHAFDVAGDPVAGHRGDVDQFPVQLVVHGQRGDDVRRHTGDRDRAGDRGRDQRGEPVVQRPVADRKDRAQPADHGGVSRST